MKPKSYPWNLLKALLGSPNSSFSSSSSAGDSLSVVSILEEFRQSGKQMKPSNPPRNFKSSAPSGPLTRKILNAKDSLRSMLQILDRWNGEGSQIKLSELHNLTKKLRQRRRFNHALQVAEWMSDQRRFNLLAEHFAVSWRKLKP
ncbi:Pentatricopeptide repeat (PPR) superfamily protein [Euphorbia peplus]|nr:Pentatricopeptide repeat (PPR) superfamily protein [Euphorbia peplus]